VVIGRPKFSLNCNSPCIISGTLIEDKFKNHSLLGVTTEELQGWEKEERFKKMGLDKCPGNSGIGHRE